MLPECRWMFRHLRNQTRLTVHNWRRDLSAWRRYWRSYAKYQAMLGPDARVQVGRLYPCLGDDTAETAIEPTYFFQGSWAFERIFKTGAQWHVDVASEHFFVALLSKIVPVTMIDIRPLSVKLDSLSFRKGTVLQMPYEDGSVPSVSSMCVLEHIGLGRYGDPLDPDGTKKSIAELKRIVQPGGNLYVSLPLDDVDTTYFNAHRAFTEATLLSLFSPFEVLDRKYIFGNSFQDFQGKGFGTGCYHLRRPV